MSQYLTTRYPGIFQYVGKKGTAYGMDYYAGGKKHREIIGPRLGEAQKKLAEKKDLAKKGVVLSAAAMRKITFKDLEKKYTKLQEGTGSMRNRKNMSSRPFQIILEIGSYSRSQP
jgi:hypothetical protein